MRERLVLGSVNYATLLCSGENPAIALWTVNSQTSHKIADIKPITKAPLRSGNAQFVPGFAVAGNNKWTFIPTLTAAYSDKTTDQWTFFEPLSTPAMAASRKGRIHYRVVEALGGRKQLSSSESRFFEPSPRRMQPLSRPSAFEPPEAPDRLNRSSCSVER